MKNQHDLSAHFYVDSENNSTKVCEHLKAKFQAYQNVKKGFNQKFMRIGNVKVHMM